MEERKALTGKILIAVIVILLVAIVGLLAYMVIQNNNTKNDTANQGNVTNVTEVGSSTSVNSDDNQSSGVVDVIQTGNDTTNGLTNDAVNDELVGTVAFGFDNDFSLINEDPNANPMINFFAIKNDGSTVKILNDSQINTSNLFNSAANSWHYCYSNGYLYFISCIDKPDIETNIYSINLKAGNQNYDFTKIYTIEKGEYLAPNGIKVCNNNIYFSIDSISPSSTEISSYNLLTNQYTNIKTFTTFGNFDIDKINNILYYADDNNIYKYDIATGTETLIESDISKSYPYSSPIYIVANNSGLVYVSAANNDGREYSQYNLKTNSTAVITSNGGSFLSPLIPYNNSYVYVKSNYIYMNTNNEETKLYTMTYDRLSFDLIGNKLQIEDYVIGGSPQKYVTIDLTNNTQSNAAAIYYNIINVD
ncbi:MAG: hypothetical protein FWF46_05840 [Oscillospiraceae bacterium]|nr:hypothetical protein [Oscillospiraceae bacterium]